MATVNRKKQVQNYLYHLDQQKYRDFELIVVDQNQDDRLAETLNFYKDRFSILHLHAKANGASRARNLGIQHGRGNIFTFPDDDCWYPPTLLADVYSFFADHSNADILSVRSVDHLFGNSHVSWSRSEGFINRYSMWNRVVEFSMFLRSEVIRQVGDFDEFLGVGAGTRWGSGEGPDYLLRALKANFSIYYNPNYLIYHPQPVQIYNTKSITRAYSYGGGIGAILKKHQYPFWFVSYQWIRSMGGIFASLLSGKPNKARYYLAALWGKITGWITK